MIVLRLPVPPSVNSSTRNLKGRGRVKTGAYVKWLREADRWLMSQKRGLGQIRGKCQIAIRIPPVRGDVSNYIKVAEDYLVSREITGDDKHNRKVSIETDDSVDCCVITISPL